MARKILVSALDCPYELTNERIVFKEQWFSGKQINFKLRSTNNTVVWQAAHRPKRGNTLNADGVNVLAIFKKDGKKYSFLVKQYRILILRWCLEFCVEFPTQGCFCRAELPGYCSFCQQELANSHMYVSTNGQCQIVSDEEARSCRLLERAKESSKRILSFARKSIYVFPIFTHTCYEAEICEECSDALRQYR